MIDVEHIIMFGSEKPVRADAVDVVKHGLKTIEACESQYRAAESKLKDCARADRTSRICLGGLLVGMRSAWPARGPNAKGWGDFLAACGISQDSALRYMELARSARTGHFPQCGKPGPSGVVKMTRDYARRIRALLGEQHEAGFGLVIAAELRALAEEIESAAIATPRGEL